MDIDLYLINIIFYNIDLHDGVYNMYVLNHRNWLNYNMAIIILHLGNFGSHFDDPNRSYCKPHREL